MLRVAVRSVCAAVCVVLLTAGLCFAQKAPAALSADPPLDKAHPAGMESFQIPSHGEPMNAIAYIAAGEGPHPVVMLLHGFPGNEKNLDLAQAIRRAGWDVIFFNYRGSWGTSGAFSFSHAIEDTAAAIAYVRVPANAVKLRANPNRIVLIGHSMGGFMAAYAGSHDQAIVGTGLISAANFYDWSGGEVKAGGEAANRTRLIKSIVDNDILPLAGCTGERLADDMLSHRKQWNFVEYAAMFGSRPLLVVTSDDGLAGPAGRLAAAVKQTPNARVTEEHLVTDHSYSDHRIALETTVLHWLGTLQ